MYSCLFIYFESIQQRSTYRKFRCQVTQYHFAITFKIFARQNLLSAEFELILHVFIYIWLNIFNMELNKIFLKIKENLIEIIP